MKHIAVFEKVSYEQFYQDYYTVNPQLSNDEIKAIYAQIKLPQRATIGSGGYDFYLPDTLKLHCNQEVTIVTGIKVKIHEGWVLMIYPRSSLGFKYCLQLHNSTGVIDSDYYYSDNEGHIFVRMGIRPYEDKSLELQAHTAFVQGIFVQYGLADNDDVKTLRNGGIGSTNK